MRSPTQQPCGEPCVRRDERVKPGDGRTYDTTHEWLWSCPAVALTCCHALLLLRAPRARGVPAGGRAWTAGRVNLFGRETLRRPRVPPVRLLGGRLGGQRSQWKAGGDEPDRTRV